MNSEERYFQHFEESIKRYSESELESMLPLVMDKTTADFDHRYSFEVNLLYKDPGRRPYEQQSLRPIPLMVTLICRNWRQLASPRGIPASYEYVSHTAS